MRSMFAKVSSSHNRAPPTHQSSSMESEQSLPPNVTIVRLISKREWSFLEHFLNTFGLDLPIDDPGITDAVTPDIVIHFAARFQAPLRTISTLAQLFPTSLESADATGRYPIHVAAKWGAMPDVIQFLLKSNLTAAGVQDSLGKTPMHYIAEFYALNYSPRKAQILPMQDSMLQCVKLLKTAAPASVNLEDNEGCNAIEYALENELDIKVVKAMQRACRDDWRERKAEVSGDQGRKTHEDLVKDVQLRARMLQAQMSSRRLNPDGMEVEETKLGDTGRVSFHRVSGMSNSFVAKTA
jgi:hypothetical protein